MTNAKLEAICLAIEFIEDNLREEITVGDIAESAGYSLYHFIRTFNQTVQHPPYNYLMRRRLSEAVRDLERGKRRILDTALEFCFHNHETFLRAFKRMFGIQPSQWSGEKANMLLPKLTKEYLTYINAKGFLLPHLEKSLERSRIRFVHRGAPSTLDFMLGYINHTWLPQAEISLAHPVEKALFRNSHIPNEMVALIPTVSQS